MPCPICAGVFGMSFPDCFSPVVPGTDLTKPSQIIIKFNFNDDGTYSLEDDVEFNPLFASIDGTEFTFTFDVGGTGSGTWTYAPGAGDPVITAFTANPNSIAIDGTSDATLGRLTVG
jgi:hypothetical protein